MFTSKFRIVSLGYVCKDKERNSLLVECWPAEIIPTYEGKLNSEAETWVTEGVNMSGSQFKLKVKCTESLKCEWLPETQRETPPDVRVGERVLIWQYANSDRYWWTSMGLDDHLRRGEQIKYRFSDLPASETRDITPEDYVQLDVNTYEGYIHLRTSQANNEPFLHELRLNFAEGVLRYNDDIGNEVFVDSAENHIKLVNADESMLELNKENLNAQVNDSMSFIAENTISFECTDFKIKCKTYLNDSDEYTANTTKYALNTDTLAIECATGTITGKIAFSDPVSFGASTSFAGAAEFAGMVDIAGDISANKGTFSGPISAPNKKC